MSDDVQAEASTQGEDEDRTADLSLVEEVDAIVNMLRYTLDWANLLDDGSSVLNLKVEDALEEAVKWRARLLN